MSSIRSMPNLRLATAAAMIGAAAMCHGAPAIHFPSRPIRVIVVSPAGGTTDIIARQVALLLGAGLGQEVVIDNRPDAAGVVAAQTVATSNADGYTLLWTHTGHTVLPSVHTQLPYDPIRDF